MSLRTRALGRAMGRGIVVGAVAALIYAVLAAGWLAGEGCAALGGAGPWLAIRFGVSFAAVGMCAAALAGAIEGALLHMTQRVANRLARGDEGGDGWQALAVTVILSPIVAGLVILGHAGRTAQARAGVALALVAATFALVRGALAARAWLQWSPNGIRARRGLVIAVVLVCLGAAAIIVDARILVRRYGWIHIGIELGAFAAFQLAVIAAANGLRTITPRWTLAVLAASLVAGIFGLSAWNQSDAGPLRAVATECGGAADHLLDLARLARLQSASAPLAGGAVDEPPRAASADDPDLPRRPGADVILITVDALRADHLGAYGYTRPTSPHLDALAADSVVFDHAYSAIPHTSYSVTTILGGAPTHSLAQIDKLAGLPTLVDVFTAAGYGTAGFFSPAIFYIDRPYFAGFEAKKLGFGRTDYVYFSETEDAVKRTDDVIGFLADAHPAHAFVWVHYFAPHEPYVDHPEMGAPFGDGAMDRYDGEIRWADREIGRLLEYLHRERPGAIILFTADHGEEFGEHGGSYHGSSLYEEQLHVPLIVHVPGVAPHRVAAPVGSVDDAPTLAALAGLPAPGGARGIDLSPWIGSSSRSEATLPLVFSEIDTSKLVAAGSNRLICDVTRGFCRLYSLADDPRETINLSTTHAARAAELEGALQAWMAGIGGATGGAGGERARTLELGELGERSAIPKLAAILVDPSADVPARQSASRSILRLLGGDGTADVDGATRANLALAASDADETTRAWSQVAMALVGDSAALTAVAAFLPPGELGARAAVALAVNHRPEAATALIAALAGPPLAEPLAIQAIEALGATRDPAGLPTLLHEYEDVRLRKFATLAMGRLRDPPDLATLVAFLEGHMIDDPYVSVRAACAHALGDLGIHPAVKELRERFAVDTEPSVVGSAAWALAQLGDAIPVVDGRAQIIGPVTREIWLIPATSPAGPLAVTVDGTPFTVDTTIARDAYSISFKAPEKTIEVRVTTGKLSHVFSR